MAALNTVGSPVHCSPNFTVPWILIMVHTFSCHFQKLWLERHKSFYFINFYLHNAVALSTFTFSAALTTIHLQHFCHIVN